jgi:hypothetical protein
VVTSLVTTKRRLKMLKRLARWRKDGRYAFSANADEKWKFASYGHTPSSKRSMGSRSKLLDAIAVRYRRARRGGGRFFVNDNGAYFQAEGAPREWFLRFKFVKNLKNQPS